MEFLQRAKLHVSWYLSFNCLVGQDRELKRNKNIIGLVKSAVPEKIIFKPNEKIYVKGYIDRELDHKATPVILQESE